MVCENLWCSLLFFIIVSLFLTVLRTASAETDHENKTTSARIPDQKTTKKPASGTKPPAIEENSVFYEHRWEFLLLIAIILVIILAGILQLTNYRMLRRSGEPNFCLQPKLPRLIKNKSGPPVPPCAPLTDGDLIPVVEL